MRLYVIEHTIALQNAREWLYPSGILTDVETCLAESFLSLLNKHVDEFNATVRDTPPGDEEMYYSADDMKRLDEDKQHLVAKYPFRKQEYRALLNEPRIPPHELRLKPDYVFTIVRKMSLDIRLVKNKHVIVESVHKKSWRYAWFHKPARSDSSLNGPFHALYLKENQNKHFE